MIKVRRTVFIRSLAFRTFMGSEFKQLFGAFVLYGFRFRALSLFLSSFFLFKESIRKDPFQAFFLSLESLRPIVGLRGKMIAGFFVKIPCLLSVSSANAMVFHWILRSVQSVRRDRREQKLASEFIDIYFLRGFAFNQLRSLYLDILDNVSFLKFIRRRWRRPKKRRYKKVMKTRLFWGLQYTRKKR